MSDIVGQLRRIAFTAFENEEEDANAVLAAADEIDRLRAKLAEYENAPVRLRHILATGTMPPEDMK